MTKCSVSLVISEMQIKTISRNYRIPLDLQKFWSLTIASIGQDAEKLKISHKLVGVEIWYRHLEKKFTPTSKVEDMDTDIPSYLAIPFFVHPQIPLLALYSRETLAHVHKDTYTKLFTAVLLQ